MVKRANGLREEELVEWFREFFIAKKDVSVPNSLWNFSMGVKAVDRVSMEIAKEFRRAVGPVRALLKKDVITRVAPLGREQS